MQVTAVAGTKAGGGLLWPRSPRMPIAARERGLSIDRIDRTVATRDFLAKAGVRPKRVEPRYSAGLGVAAAIARTAVVVALASLAILVLLPAAIAAQAASAF
jgi:hypothetical protein